MFDVCTVQQVMVISAVKICDSKECASERDISREKKIIANSVLIGILFTQQLVPDIPWSPVLNLFPFQPRPLCSAVKGGLTPKNPFSARVCQSKQPFPQPATFPEGQRDGSSIRTINHLIIELPSHLFRQPSKCYTKSSIKTTWVGHKNVTFLSFKSVLNTTRRGAETFMVQRVQHTVL